MLFHIDDLLVSHAGPEIVTCKVKKCDMTHGRKYPLVVTRRKTHEYLGMTIDFSLKERG